MSFPSIRLGFPAGPPGVRPVTSNSQLLMSRSPPMPSRPGSDGPGPRTPGSPCCDNGRPILTDPATGQTICSCQYPASLLASAAYSRMTAPAGLTAENVYGSYAASAAQGLAQLGSDPATLYPTLNPPYELKEGPDGLRSLVAPQPLSYYPYEAAALGGYPYSYGSMDLSNAARRKNATRENTNTLKAWLYEHRKNPYPTKGEKIMLAIITKMTLTQVSTWFANARRRLKKENKMTWSPRNRPEDEDDDDDVLIDNETITREAEKLKKSTEDTDMHTFTKMVDIDDEDDEIIDAGTENYPHDSASTSSEKESTVYQNQMCDNNRLSDHSDGPDSHPNSRSCSPERVAHNELTPSVTTSSIPTNSQQVPRIHSIKDRHLNVPHEKPKIWSVAEMASSTSSRRESQDRRSPSPERHSTRSKSPVHAAPQVGSIPVRPSVSLGGHFGHHPTGMSPMSAAMAPHPAHLNGLRPPWMGLSGGYPLPFHPGALAHPYLLAAAAPHMGSPMGNMTQHAIRSHHDLLKLQAASLQMNGHVPERSSTDAPVRSNPQPSDLTEATAFRPVPTRPTMAC